MKSKKEFRVYKQKDLEANIYFDPNYCEERNLEVYCPHAQIFINTMGAPTESYTIVCTAEYSLNKLKANECYVHRTGKIGNCPLRSRGLMVR